MNKLVFLEVVISTLVLMSGAFYNEFPLITGDSAIYISSGFDGIVPSERPIFYGWFIRFFSISTTLWGPIFVQNLILSLLLIKLIGFLLSDLIMSKRIAVIIAVAFFTQAIWETNKLMADIFIAYSAIALFMWCFVPLNRIWKGLLLSLIFYSSATHNSHAIIAVLAVLVLGFYFFIKRERLALNKLKWLIIPVMLAPLSIGITNYYHGNGFTLGKATSVFLVGKMCENGILQEYLNDQCEKQNLSLCAFKDSLPHVAWQFVWHPESPVMKTGGWAPNDEEYKKIVMQTFTTPKYLWMHIWKGIVTTLVQLSQITAGDALFRYEEYDNSMMAIRKYFPHETNPALWTRQRIMELDFNLYSRLYGIFFIVSTIIVCWHWQKFLLNKYWIFLLVIIVTFVVINAGVTANLANISSRLQARIFWLLPLWNILVLVQYYIQKKGNIPESV
jgi:hypothetical protein